MRDWERERDAVQSSIERSKQAARRTVVKRLENRRSPKGDVNLAAMEGGRRSEHSGSSQRASPLGADACSRLSRKGTSDRPG